MTKSRNAMALLTAECPEEPYLGGVSYCCIAPGKSCQPMQSLSGGEKTVAAIALLISMHMYVRIIVPQEYLGNRTLYKYDQFILP